MSRLEIDASRCEGHGRCYDIAPDVFESDDYGHGSVITGVDPAAVDHKRLLEVVRQCPERAVTFEP